MGIAPVFGFGTRVFAEFDAVLRAKMVALAALVVNLGDFAIASCTETLLGTDVRKATGIERPDVRGMAVVAGNFVERASLSVLCTEGRSY
eukprot:COSAG05_NODE_8819_length_669_cov_0.778947_1_plen_90_part_00